MSDIFEPDVINDAGSQPDAMVLAQCQSFLNPNEYLDNLRPEIRDRILAVIGRDDIHVVLHNGPECGRFITLPSPICNGEIPQSSGIINFQGDVVVLEGSGYSMVGESGSMLYQDFKNACSEFTREPISAMGIQFKPLNTFSESEIQAVIKNRDIDQIVVELTAYKGEYQITVTGQEITKFLKAGDSLEFDPKTKEIVEFFSGFSESDIASIVEEAEASENSQYQGTGCNTTDPSRPAGNYTEILNDPLSTAILCMMVWKVARISARLQLSRILSFFSPNGKK